MGKKNCLFNCVQMTDVKLNCSCNIAIHETIELCPNKTTSVRYLKPFYCVQRND